MRMARVLGLLPLLPILSVTAFAQEAPVDSGAAPLVASIPTPPPAPGVAGSAVAAALATLDQDAIFQSAVVSVEVVDARTGTPVYAWGDDRPLLPASTMKLLTAAVALRELGPAWRFPTWLRHDGELGADGVLDGNLYVVGQGDPTMVVERMWRMVADLRLRGVREVKGDVVFDESYYADTTATPGWDKEEDVSDGPTYFATLGALSVNYNIATMVIRPGAEVGQPAFAEFDTATPVVVLDNQVTTGRARSRKWFKVERAVDAETGRITTFKVTGNMPVDEEPDRIYRTLADPLGNYMGAFETVAKQAGIKVKGKYRPGVAPVDAVTLLRSESEALTDILTDMNKHSNNFMAEQVLRTVGAERKGLPGTTKKGVDVVADYLTALGIPSADYRLVNGSGLSRDIHLRPSHVDRVLVDMYNNHELANEFVGSLAVGGRDGTLWSRFREDGMQGRVRGKTGTLGGVHCLSGYVRAVDGETYAFTFLVNEIDGALARARRAHDRLVLSLAGADAGLADGADGDATTP